MFLSFWIWWALIGLAAATALFWWALKSRQFEDSRRASLLPFDDIEPESPSGEKVKRGRLTLLVIAFVFTLGVLSAIILLIQAFR